MLNDVLLVTRSYQGDKEMNFLSTMEEFINKWCADESPDISEGLSKAVLGAKPYEWGYYAAKGDDIFELRLCQGEEDLISFLSGKTNDSISAREDRFPGSVGLHKHWYWENSPDLFSVKAVEKVNEYMNQQAGFGKDFAGELLSVMPDFPEKVETVQPKTKRLADIIREAEESKTIVSGRDSVSLGLDL